LKRELHSKRTVALFLALSLFLFLPFRLAAQLDRGEVTGTAMDPSGAAISGAKIVLTNDATNVRARTISTTTGTYVFDNLLPGTYSIDAQAAGFEKYVEHGLYVHVQQVLNADIRFTTGNVQESVTVTAAAPLLQAENGALGQTISTQTVNDLPLVTRDWGSLAQLSAGVSTAPPGQPTPDSGSTESAYFSVNGVNVWQNDFRLNGINDNIEFYGGNYTGTNAAIVPPPDAIQEFTVQSGDFNAEFGHSTGGVVNAAIKSGSNGLHGDLWEYVRNDAFNANYYFNSGKPVPEYRQNLFGGTAGGPVILPHLYNGKDKTFFFFDYQGGRYVLPITAGGQTVPTMGMVNSSFTNLQDNIAFNSGSATDALGRKFPHGAILDPATTRQLPSSGIDPITGLTGTPGSYVRDPFYNCTISGCPNFAGNNTRDFTPAGQEALLNIIPTSRLDPQAVKLLGVYPLPTVSGKLVNNFPSYVPKESKTTDTWDIRIDHNFNSNNIIFGVFDRSLFSVVVPSNLPGVAVGETGGRNDTLPAYAWAAGYTRVITPTTTNECTSAWFTVTSFNNPFMETPLESRRSTASAGFSRWPTTAAFRPSPSTD